MANSTAASREDLGKLVLRLALGSVLLFHGVFKLRHGVDWIRQTLGTVGLPGFLAHGAYVAEILAPVLLVLGVRARLAASIIAIEMVAAVLLVLRSKVFTVNENGGGWAIELEALVFFAAVAIFLTGSGKYRLGGPPGPWD
ncbi:MAG: DoxX family protein [Gemmatimonadota bacterium]